MDKRNFTVFGALWRPISLEFNWGTSALSLLPSPGFALFALP